MRGIEVGWLDPTWVDPKIQQHVEKLMQDDADARAREVERMSAWIAEHGQDTIGVLFATPHTQDELENIRKVQALLQSDVPEWSAPSVDQLMSQPVSQPVSLCRHGIPLDPGDTCSYCDQEDYVQANQPPIRTFDTGACRDSDNDKIDFEGFLSPLVIERFAQYMHKHRRMPDGSMRDSDNWQKGIPLVVYMKSLWRHFFDVWKLHRRGEVDEDALCGILFNTSGYLHEHLKQAQTKDRYRGG